MCKADRVNGKGSRPCADRSRSDLPVWKGSEGLQHPYCFVFPTLEELGKAAELFVICVKLASAEKLLGEE